MVKGLDNSQRDTTAGTDHLGWTLWKAAAAWKSRFADAMVAAGHTWYAEARSSVVPFIAVDGTRQTELVRKMGLTKQAVQQLVDDLEREGVVSRRPDPEDRRGKIVAFTTKGLKARDDALVIKARLEEDYRKKLGDDNFKRLHDLLEILASDC